MTSTFALALVLAAPPLSFAERVDGAQAVERARYAFVISATKPFNELYPRSVFETPDEPGKNSDAPVPVDPEMAKALENLFSVFRVVTSDPGEWLVGAVRIPKRDFDRWLEDLLGQP